MSTLVWITREIRLLMVQQLVTQHLNIIRRDIQIKFRIRGSKAGTVTFRTLISVPKTAILAKGKTLFCNLLMSELLLYGRLKTWGFEKGISTQRVTWTQDWLAETRSVNWQWNMLHHSATYLVNNAPYIEMFHFLHLFFFIHCVYRIKWKAMFSLMRSITNTKAFYLTFVIHYFTQ